MTKVKIISSIHAKSLEDAINTFIEDVKYVREIKYCTVFDDRSSRLQYSAMIIYDIYEENN